MSLKFEINIYCDKLTCRRYGKLHRVDMPSLVYKDGDMSWFEYGKSHRIGGPAFWYGKSWYPMYYIRGVPYNKVEYESEIRNM